MKKEPATNLQAINAQLRREIAARERATAAQERLAAQLRAAADLAEHINAIHDPAQLLHEVVTQLHHRFDLYHVHLYLLDEEMRELTMHAGSGASLSAFDQGRSIPLDREPSPIARAARERAIVPAAPASHPPPTEARAELAVPLIVGNRVLGVLDVQDERPDRFTPPELDVLSTLAGQIATALQNAGYIEQVEDNLIETLTCMRVAQALEGELTEEQVLDALVQVANFYPRTRVTIYTHDPDAGEPTVILRRDAAFGSGVVPMAPIGTRLSRAQFPIMQHATPDEPFVSGNLLLDERLDPASHKLTRWMKASSCAILPITTGDEWLGLVMVSSQEDAYFDEHKLHLYQSLAKEGATALQAARLRTGDQVKGEFLAHMSHELRTPLNSIMGFAEVLLMGISGELPFEAREDVQAIFDNGMHLLDIVNDVLDLSKIETGSLTLHREPIQIVALLEGVKANNAGLLVDKPVTMLVQATGDLPTLEADPVRLNQIMNNLVSNAVKFTQKGRITLRAFREDASHENTGTVWICIAVQDTGIGIDEDDLEKIFERFQQVSDSDVQHAQGTGLGLSITRQLIELHGGTIEVQSQLGKGSTFTVRLPIDS